LTEREGRGLLIINGILCIASGIGYVLANQVGAANQMFSALEMGFGVLAWAVILPLATVLVEQRRLSLGGSASLSDK
jgi:hypothetical protein